MRRFLSVLLILLLLCGCAGCAAQGERATGTRLIALNAGKADALLLLFDDQAYLIDSGYQYTYNRLAETLRQYDVTRLNGVFLSHCDKDHYGGLMDLARSDIAVDAWYAASIYYDLPGGQHPMELAAAERNDSVRYLSAGDTLALGTSGILKVLGPLTCNTENENNNSLVFSVETDDGTLLFTGDMKLNEEAELLSAGLIAHADLLKVPFHGDNSASSESFVQAVEPAAALICTSTAEEPDTPASSVLKRYGRVGAQVYVTQDTPIGYELTLQNGQVTAKELDWALPDPAIHLRAEITPQEDLLTLYNNGAEDISLAGWIVYSTRGEDCIVLPEDAVIPANGAFRLGTRATAADTDLSLDIKRLWHKSKRDQMILLDAHGTTAAVTDNGISE